MTDCLFCKIVAKEIPNYTVYEDDHVLAFLDIEPCAKGHTVVIPKKHYDDIVDMAAEDVGEFFQGVKRATGRVKDVVEPDGFNIGINHGRAGGNSLDHMHVHIIPRWFEDGGGSMHTIIKGESDMSVEDLAKQFA